MHIRTILIPTLLAAAGAAQAADGGSWDFYARAQASAGLLGLSGDASYQKDGIAASTISTDGIGLDDAEISPAIELGVGTPIFDFHAFLGWQSWETDGSGTLSQTVSFGGQSYTGGTQIASKASVEDLYLEANWSPIALNLAGFSIGVAVHRLSVSAELDNGLVRSEFDESAILPMLALRAYVAPLDMLEVEAMVHALSVPLGDVSGTVAYGQIQASYYPMEYIGVNLGWRHAMIDVEIEDGGDKAKADVSLSGPFLGLSAQF